MKRSIIYAGTFVALVTMLAMSITASAAGGQPAAPGKNKLTCFADGGGACTTNKAGTSATLDTTGGGDAGTYLAGYNSSFYGVRVAQVTALSFTYTGVAGVDPRWSIPIDEFGVNLDPDGDGRSGDGYTDYFLFVSASACNNGAGLVDVINNPTCTINRSDSAVTYPNWTAYITANTNDKIALLDFFAFVIADSTPGGGVWTISNVVVGKPGK